MYQKMKLKLKHKNARSAKSVRSVNYGKTRFQYPIGATSYEYRTSLHPFAIFMRLAIWERLLHHLLLVMGDRTVFSFTRSMYCPFAWQLFRSYRTKSEFPLSTFVGIKVSFHSLLL